MRRDLCCHIGLVVFISLLTVIRISAKSDAQAFAPYIFDVQEPL